MREAPASRDDAEGQEKAGMRESFYSAMGALVQDTCREHQSQLHLASSGKQPGFEVLFGVILSC